MRRIAWRAGERCVSFCLEEDLGAALGGAREGEVRRRLHLGVGLGDLPSFEKAEELGELGDHVSCN